MRFEQDVNMTQCDETTARFLAASLTRQAKDVREYARTYPAEFAARADKDGRKWLAHFRKTAKNLIEEVVALSLLTRRTPVWNHLNGELIEAYVEDARAAVAATDPVPTAIPAFVN